MRYQRVVFRILRRGNLRLPSLPIRAHPSHKIPRLLSVNSSSDRLRASLKLEFAVFYQSQECPQILLVVAAVRLFKDSVSDQRQIVLFTEKVSELVEFAAEPF